MLSAKLNDVKGHDLTELREVTVITRKHSSRMRTDRRSGRRGEENPNPRNHRKAMGLGTWKEPETRDTQPPWTDKHL